MPWFPALTGRAPGAADTADAEHRIRDILGEPCERSRDSRRRPGATRHSGLALIVTGPGNVGSGIPDGVSTPFTGSSHRHCEGRPTVVESVRVEKIVSSWHGPGYCLLPDGC